MEYRFTEKEDFSFLASGNVIKHFSGMPCFPVRLGLEFFERAYYLIGKEKITVYDPCCGSGFSMSVLGMIKQNKISSLYGSDIDPSCLEAASCNTAMLTREGMIAARDKFLRNENTTDERTQMRIEQLNESVEKLLPYLNNPTMQSKVFMHDILSVPPSLPEPADYVFADIPYGIMTEWKTNDESESNPVQRLIQNITPIMSENGVLVVCGAKDLRIKTELLRRVEKIHAGKRLVYLMRRNN